MQTMKILIDSNSPNLKSISNKLLKNSGMKIWAVRSCQNLKIIEQVRCWFPAFRLLMGRKGMKWWKYLEESTGQILLSGIEKWAGVQIIDLSYHALQIKSLKNDKLDERLDKCWG